MHRDVEGISTTVYTAQVGRIFLLRIRYPDCGSYRQALAERAYRDCVRYSVEHDHYGTRVLCSRFCPTKFNDIHIPLSNCSCLTLILCLLVIFREKLRQENKATMLGFIACLWLLMAYMVYRLIALYEPLTGDPTTDPYFFSRKTMTVFGKCSKTFVWHLSWYRIRTASI